MFEPMADSRYFLIKVRIPLKKLSDSIELEIEAALEEPMETVSSRQLGRAERVEDAPGRYIELCKSTIPFGMSLKGLKIVVDCAHGATYHIAPNVLSELGADVIEIGTKPMIDIGDAIKTQKVIDETEFANIINGVFRGE